MRITKEQLAKLSTLQCVRLSSNEAHLQDVDGFLVPRNPNLAEPLLNEAFRDDEERRVAYYLVKDTTGGILFYFSLKCGMLYDQSLTEENIVLFQQFTRCLEQMQNDTDATEEERAKAVFLLERLRVHKGITKNDLETFKRKKWDAIDNLNDAITDTTRAVGKTFAGIEIVHFVANGATRDRWDALELPQRLGVTVFWHFLVPIVQAAMSLVGCEYLFLFAADSTPDETLVNYYRSVLMFDDDKERNTAIPRYDLSCKFMYQETCDLEEKRTMFYDHFNQDKDEV